MNNIIKILKILKSYNYPLKSGLNYENEFTFLVAIILSAQSKDEFINTQTKELFQKYNTAEKMLNLGSDIFSYIKKIGLWRNKGKNILNLCKELIELKNNPNIQSWYENFYNYNSLNGDLIIHNTSILSKEYIPTFRLGLLQLSGVGRKTANVFLNVMYKAAVIPVDTHVKRVSSRLGLSFFSDPLKIELQLEEIIPSIYKAEFSHYLIWHGRRVCTAKKPKCLECELKHLCPFFNFINNKL